MSGLSSCQYYSLLAAGATSSILSLMGSSAIVFRACHNRGKLYERLLITLSVGDILFSTSNLVHPYLMPKGTPGLLLASGNTATCSLAGFVMTSAPLFITLGNCYLSAYFYLMICKNWNEEFSSRYIEKAGLSLATLVSFGTGVAGVVTDSFNPSTLMHVCYFNDFPQDCSDQVEIDCERGEMGDKIGWFSIVVLMVAAVVGSLLTYRVHAQVKTTVNQQRRHSISFSEQVSPTVSRKKTVVAQQAVLYTMAYINSFIWPFLAFGVNEAIGDVRGREGEPGLFALQFLAWSLFPVQGLLNSFVYFRVSYRQWRTVEPQQSRLRTLRNCIFVGPVPLDIRSQAQSPSARMDDAATKSSTAGISIQ